MQSVLQLKYNLLLDCGEVFSSTKNLSEHEKIHFRRCPDLEEFEIPVSATYTTPRVLHTPKITTSNLSTLDMFMSSIVQIKESVIKQLILLVKEGKEKEKSQKFSKHSGTNLTDSGSNNREVRTT